jgi:hypothetical protein
MLSVRSTGKIVIGFFSGRFGKYLRPSALDRSAEIFV